MSLRTTITKIPVARIARVLTVVAVAASAGHLVQMIAARKSAPAVAEVVKPTHIVEMSSGGASDMAASPVNAAPHRLAVETPSLLPGVTPCTMALTLKVLPYAMIGVTVSSRCRAGERVVLRHSGLAVTAKVGPDGAIATQLPAMTADGAVVVLFGDGTRLDQAVAIPEVAALRRLGVQWQGPDAFALHGMQDGADFDQPGDVWHGNPGDGATGGFLTVLGDSTVENPLLAEVYTYPAGSAQNAEIVLEAAVLDQTCGHDLLGEVVSSTGGQIKSMDLTLAMPDCSAVGDFLVLNNLASDMKIAAN